MTAAKHHSAIIGRLCVVLQKATHRIPVDRFDCDGRFVGQHDVEAHYEQPWSGVVVDVQSLVDGDGDIESVFLVADSIGAVFPVRRSRIRLQMGHKEQRAIAEIGDDLPAWADNKAEAIKKALRQMPDHFKPTEKWLAAQAAGGS